MTDVLVYCIGATKSVVWSCFRIERLYNTAPGHTQLVSPSVSSKAHEDSIGHLDVQVSVYLEIQSCVGGFDCCDDGMLLTTDCCVLQCFIIKGQRALMQK